MNKKMFLFASLLLCSIASISFGSVPIVPDNNPEMIHKESVISSNQALSPLVSSLESKYIEITPLIFDLNQLPPVFQNGQVDFFLVNDRCGRLFKTESAA